MFKKISKKVLVIAILCVALVVILGLIALIAAVMSDGNRLVYELKTDNTYEVVDIKDTYRGGMFAKESITIPATHRGKAVTSVKTLKLNKTHEVILSEGIVTIADNAFYNSNISKITLPNSLVYIGTFAFSDCVNLEEIVLPDGLTSIEEGTFNNCSGLKNITIPNSVKSVATNAFNGCTSLVTTEEGGMRYLGSKSNPHLLLMGAKDKTVTSCDIHADTKVIVDKAFSGCAALTSITIHDGVTHIGANAFEKCTALTSVTMGAGVKQLGNRAFLECSALTAINFNGTTTQWNAIKKPTTNANAWNRDSAIAQIVCSDETIEL